MASVDETLQMPLSVESQGVVYQDRAQKVERVVARFSGFTKEYFVSDHGERAAVVAIRDGHVLLTRQYRLLINRLSYEIPGGGVEAGEDAAAAAARECLEETGVRCSSLRPLINYQAGLDVWKNYTHVFTSTDCVDEGGQPERRVWIPFEQCLRMVFDEEITDSLSTICLLAYNARPARQ